MGVAVAADIIVSFKDGDFMLLVQFIGGDIAGNAGTDDGDFHAFLTVLSNNRVYSALGRAAINLYKKLKVLGKLISGLRLAIPSAMMRAASSTSMRIGMGKSFLSVNGVRTNPGQTVNTSMF